MLLFTYRIIKYCLSVNCIIIFLDGRLKVNQEQKFDNFLKPGSLPVRVRDLEKTAANHIFEKEKETGYHLFKNTILTTMNDEWAAARAVKWNIGNRKKEAEADPKMEAMKQVVSETYYLSHFMAFFSYFVVRSSAAAVLSPHIIHHLFYRVTYHLPFSRLSTFLIWFLFFFKIYSCRRFKLFLHFPC